MLPVPTLDYLAQFSGRGVDTYTPYAEQALAQATLMFSTVTKLEEFPTDPDLMQLAINGILQMADRLYLEQPWATAKANPYNSETIGSYSYSKGVTSISMTAGRAALHGDLTGLFWWDLAVEELSQVERSVITSGSVRVFDHDLRRLAMTGQPVLIGPADVPGYVEILPPGNDVELVPVDEGVVDAATDGSWGTRG
jgi:hypothetical protein